MEVWRARIGSFNKGSHVFLRSFFKHGSSLRSAVAFAMPLLLLTSLLLIGCVETNPGPVQYQCTVCPSSFNSVAGYAKHQELHAIKKNFMFPCFECGMDMVSVNAFKVHFSRFHSNVPADNPAPGRDDIFADVLHDATFKCTLITCQETCRTSRLLKGHMVKHLQNGHVISCPFQPCQNKFSKVSTFRTHMSQYHRAIDVGNPDEFVGERDGRIYFNSDYEESDNGDSDIEDFGHEIDASDDNEEEPQQIPFDPFQENGEEENIYPDYLVRDHLVKFYLLLEGELVLPSKKVQRISEELAIMSRISHHQIKAALKTEMAKAGIEKRSAETIINASLKKDIIYAVHHKNMDVLDLTTNYLRLKAFKQRCSFLEYESIPLGRNDAGKKKFASFIKIKDSLLHMFNDISIQKEIEASFSREPGTDIFSDFTDGSTFTQHPICSNMESIQIILFQDAFEFFPLSCASGLYKCVGFYFTLGNMSPETRSKVDSIQLTFLVTETDLKYFTPEACLEKLIDELKDLVENGIQFKDKTLPVVLMHVCGDNLGQNFIGRYTECFTTDSACRFCGITNAAIRKKPYDTLPLRTPEDYDTDASQVDPENPESCIRGIKGRSPFNEVPTFHVANPGQPPCIGHDILEGIAKKDYALFLKYFIEIKKWFSVEDVNRRIFQFRPKGRDAADGFMKLDPKLEKIRGHASEVWLFIRMLPFLISDKIQDLEDPVWKLCLELKSICEYVFAPRITSIQLAKLKELVNLYVEKRATIFNKNLQHKHHLVCHYSDLVTFFGVLIRLWTLRFESRHVFFKKAAKAANNFINITTTLANKYVLNFAYKMSNNLVSSNVIFNSKDVSTLNLDELVPPVRNLVRNEPTYDKILKTVTLHNIEYTPGQWVILGSNGKNLIVGELTLILSKMQDIKFILKVHEAENTFQGYYNINLMDYHFSSKKLKDFADYYPLSSYKFQGKCCLVLKHSNPSMDSSN